MDLGASNGDRNEMWNWKQGEYGLNSDSSLGELLHLLDEQTPIKDCALDDLGHQASELYDKSGNEEMVDCMESSQQKRRRMLQFTLETDEVMDSELMEEGLSEHLDWNEQWNFNFEGNCALNTEGLDQLSEDWLDECLVQGDTNASSAEIMNIPIDSFGHAGASDFYNNRFETEPQMVQVNPNPVRSKVIKGKKTLIRTPAKLTSSIAHPFALIKPCGGLGDLTLNEINKKIHAPPKSKLKHKVEAEWGPLATSALTGKPVVGRTKIRTEGGKGSITIMRTRG
ncbi:hypothetical protein LUZ60_015722 [Juncus effusus]|nr:hypothetical protein LUZ60_015722 [Juncus effusus]